MIDATLAWTGTATLVALVGLGVFFYPWLLDRRFGAVGVAAITLLLVPLFWSFDRRGDAAPSLVLAFVWALLPAITGVVAWWVKHRFATK